MSVGMILLFIVLFILVIYILSTLFGSQTTLNDFNTATETVTISSSTLPTGDGTNSYTYSIWVYVTDWNYRYGQDKVIFARTKPGAAGASKPINCPMVSLGKTQNNLQVELSLLPGETGGPSTFKCGIPNVPLQRWANLIISVSGRSLDIYLNGKLVRTCVMSGVPKVADGADIYLTPGPANSPGFAGYTAQFRYFPDTINPQQAWNIYRKGPGGSLLGNLLNKYKLKVSFLKDNVEQYSFSV